MTCGWLLANMGSWISLNLFKLFQTCLNLSKMVQTCFFITWNQADGGHRKRNSWHGRQTFSYRIGVLFLNINCTPSSGPDAFCQEILWHCGSHFDKLTQPVKKVINDEHIPLDEQVFRLIFVLHCRSRIIKFLWALNICRMYR